MDYSRYVKYPRSPHLPWSPGVDDDDIVIDTVECFQGKEVVVTEKMDGECFVASTKITLLDGTTTTIRNIVKKNAVGMWILGADSHGNPVPSKILNVFENGRTDEWIKVSIRTPNGGPSRKTYCTPDHLFILKDGIEKKASELKVNDTVLFGVKQFGLSENQYQILLGKLLGDGSFHILKNNTAQIQYTHSIKQIEYSAWCAQNLGVVSAPSTQEYQSGYGSSMVKRSTICTRAIYDAFSCFIKEGVKQVPSSIIEQISPIALAYLFMDDGSLIHSENQRDRILFSVCGFDNESIGVLQQCFHKFGVQSNVKVYNGYSYITLNADNTEIFCKLISAFIPQCMEYKLPIKHRNGEKESVESKYTPHSFVLYECDIDGAEYANHRSERIKYDLETSTHNYFANNVLVHNCTTMYRDHIHARSINSGYHPSRTWVQNLHGSIKFKLDENQRLCGENMFWVHSVVYTDLPSYFLLFSVWEDDVAYSWDDTVAMAEKLSDESVKLHTVPVLYRGVFDEDAIKALWNDDMYEHHEGYVVRLADSFKLEDFQSSLAKFVRKDHVQTDEHWMRSGGELNMLRVKR